MKLLIKASRTYLYFSAAILMVAGVLLYFSMMSILHEEVSERLVQNVDRFATRIEEGELIASQFPDFEINVQDEVAADTTFAQDVALFDPVLKEKEAFRQVTGVRTIRGRTYRIVVRQVILEPIDFVSSIGLTLLAVFGLILILFSWMNRRLWIGMWSPFYGTLKTLKGISLKGEQPVRFPESEIEEFQELNEVLNSWIDRSRADYQILKSFTENASHEIQTPLAVIQNRLEESLQHSDLSSEQAALIAGAHTASIRLAGLNKALLLLARIDNRQFNTNEAVSVAPLLESQLENWSEMISMRGLELKSQIKDPIDVTANAELMESMIRNLLQNAIKYSLEGGVVDISLTSGVLTFRNPGPPLSISTERLLDRFQKADPASSSPGLGLAICQSICEVHGWHLSYVTSGEDPTMHTISVQF